MYMAAGKRALLVNPWIVDFTAYDLWLRPLGLLLAGAELRRAGFDVRLIDCLDRLHPSQKTVAQKGKPNGTGKFLKTRLQTPEILRFVPRHYGRYGIPAEAFDDMLAQSPQPDVVLVTSGMTYWYPGAFEAIERIKRRWPVVPVVLGGVYATLCREHAEKNSGADFVYTGPIGSKFSELISKITGVEFETPDLLCELPMPAHDLLTDRNVAACAFSRGCPFNCTYCASKMLAPRHERRTAQQAIDEIQYLAESRGVRHIAFYDDALIVDSHDLIEPLLRFVIEKKYPLAFYTPNAMHAAYVTAELASLMKRAGFAKVVLGFESGDAGFQSATGGKTKLEEFRRAASLFRGAGFTARELGAYIICGHPLQTEDSIRAAMRECVSQGVEPLLAWYSPIPGSADFDSACAGFSRPPSLDPLLHNSTLVAYQHPSISREKFLRLNEEMQAMRIAMKN